MKSAPRLLLIGPLPIDGDVIGGTKVSFASMVAELQALERFDIEVLNTSRPQAGRGALGRFVNNLRTLFAVLRELLSPSQDFQAVVFNTSSGGALQSGPLIWLCCKLRRTPLVVRLFGGDLDLHFDRAPLPLRAIARRTVLDADLLLLQTQALCERFDESERVRWWPTTRELTMHRERSWPKAERFLFLSQLRKEKGVVEAIEASRELDDGLSLTLFGPPMRGFDIEAVLEHSDCIHGGALESHEVPAILASYDVLVFPSYHGGEGMPGILIEALQMGLPVICTRWRSLPEVIRDGENGLLIEIEDSGALADAMNRIARDPELFKCLRAGASKSGTAYRASQWNQTLANWLEDLCPETSTTRESLQEAA